MALFRKTSGAAAPVNLESAQAHDHRLALIEDMTFEVVPIKSLSSAIEVLPAGARVSVTCSPVKGIAETQRIVDGLAEQGLSAVPHISARLVRDRAHTTELAAWFRATGVTEAFVVGGDISEPHAYPGAVEFLRDLLDTDHGLGTIGVAAYPDGHAFLPTEQMTQTLRTKQELLAAAGIAGYCSTQMCFDPTTISGWMSRERREGLTLPIHLGVAGSVDKT
ncbi:MAG: methylenetetrahydrofolate reductase, partial [Acidimicrobiales bacterium]